MISCFICYMWSKKTGSEYQTVKENYTQHLCKGDNEVYKQAFSGGVIYYQYSDTHSSLFFLTFDLQSKTFIYILLIQ